MCFEVLNGQKQIIHYAMEPASLHCLGYGYYWLQMVANSVFISDMYTIYKRPNWFANSHSCKTSCIYFQIATEFKIGNRELESQQLAKLD